MMRARNIALIPLRGGSKSIPKKNIRMIAGRPLCAWALTAATSAARIDQVYASTDSDEIKEVVTKLELGVQIVDRPSQLATDEATTESVMLHLLESVPPFDRMVTVQATSPLLTAWQLDQALEQFEAGQYDSMLSAVRTKRFFWSDEGKPLNYDPQFRPRRQEFSGTLMENGAFYITKSSLLVGSGCRLGGHIGVYEMPPHAASEIDDPEDWEVVARLLEERQPEDR